MRALVLFRDGDSFYTQIDKIHTPEVLAQRMTGGGFVICRESRWGKERVLIINLSDIKCIELTELET